MSSPDNSDIESTDESLYSYPLKSNSLWSDIIPIPQADNHLHVVTIQYSHKYDELSSYLRAVMNCNEHTMRVLYLTKQLIDINSSHYTAWYYRRITLIALATAQSNNNKLLIDELDWMNYFALSNPKSYQLWQHRRSIVQYIMNNNTINKLNYDIQLELQFTAEIFADDAKNYHAWSHRQFILYTYKDVLLVSDCGSSELDYIDTLIDDDVRNNSAWTQRYFVIDNTCRYDAKTITSELEYTFTHIFRAINNDSPYNYVIGLLHETRCNHTHLQYTISQCIMILNSSECNNAHSLLVECYEISKQYDSAIEHCTKLQNNDRIRKSYWTFRIDQLKTPVST